MKVMRYKNADMEGMEQIEIKVRVTFLPTIVTGKEGTENWAVNAEPVQLKKEFSNNFSIILV